MCFALSKRLRIVYRSSEQWYLASWRPGVESFLRHFMSRRRRLAGALEKGTGGSCSQPTPTEATSPTPSGRGVHTVARACQCRVYKGLLGLQSSAPHIHPLISTEKGIRRFDTSAFSFPVRLIELSCYDGFQSGLGGGGATDRELRVDGLGGQVHRRRHVRLDHRRGLHHLGQRQEAQSRRLSRVQLRWRGAQCGGGERGRLRVVLGRQRAQHRRRQRHQHRRAQDRGEALLHLRRRRALQQRHEARRQRGRRHRRLAASQGLPGAQGVPNPRQPRHHAGHHADQLRRRHAQDPGHRARAADQAVRVGRHRAQGHGARWPGSGRACSRGTLLGPRPGWRQCRTSVGCMSSRSVNRLLRDRGFF